MKDVRTIAASVAFALLAAGCGGAVASGPTETSEEVDARKVRAVLTEANEVALIYGRKHLGHYLDLKAAKLERAGLAIPDGIQLEVRTKHTTYCIVATSQDLAAEHPWARATIGPKLQGPSPDDRCARSRY